MRTHYPTIIIGAGIAGLSCANSLIKRGEDFLVISKNIGGCLKQSKDKVVNYGAYYITEDYTNVLPYVTRGRKITELNAIFYDEEGNGKTIWSIGVGRKLQQALRYRKLLREFRGHFKEMREQAAIKSHAIAIEENQYLKELYSTPAKAWLKQHGIDEFIVEYIEHGIYVTAFRSLDELSAFYLLWLSLPFVTPSYEFTFDLEKLSNPVQDAIQIDSVTSINTESHPYTIRCKSGSEYTADNIVIATPSGPAFSLLNQENPNEAVHAYMYHLRGTRKPKYQSKHYHFFHISNPTICLAEQIDGTFLLYGRSKEGINIDEYFQSYDIIAQHNWSPAFSVRMSDTLVPVEFKEGIYMIGEHNIPSLEDCFITGVYAASQLAPQ